MWFKSGDRGGIINNLYIRDFIHSFLGHLKILGGAFILQKRRSFLIIPLAEKMGKLVPNKLRKQFSIYVPFILKTFNDTSAMGNGNHKLGHAFYSPFFVLGTAFLIQPFAFLCSHTSPWYPGLLAWISLVDPTNPIKIRRISSWSRSLVVMHGTFDKISITLGEVFSSQETLFPALVVLIAMLIQGTSDSSV